MSEVIFEFTLIPKVATIADQYKLANVSCSSDHQRNACRHPSDDAANAAADRSDAHHGTRDQPDNAVARSLNARTVRRIPCSLLVDHHSTHRAVDGRC